MSALWQSVFFGLGALSFLLAAIFAYTEPNPAPSPRRPLIWVAVGLLLVTIVPFWIAVKAS